MALPQGVISKPRLFRLCVERIAVASAVVRMKRTTVAKIKKGVVEKGDVFAAAQLAAVMAAKRTPDIVPLCHPIVLSAVRTSIQPRAAGVEIRVEVRAVERTGVEMEALTACCAAGLTIYDMLKSLDRGMVLEKVQLEEKRGGRSGTWRRR